MVLNMKLFDNIKLEYDEDDEDISINNDNGWFLISFDCNGLSRHGFIYSEIYDLDDDSKLKIIGVDEL